MPYEVEKVGRCYLLCRMHAQKWKSQLHTTKYCSKAHIPQLVLWTGRAMRETRLDCLVWIHLFYSLRLTNYSYVHSSQSMSSVMKTERRDESIPRVLWYEDSRSLPCWWSPTREPRACWHVVVCVSVAEDWHGTKKCNSLKAQWRGQRETLRSMWMVKSKMPQARPTMQSNAEHPSKTRRSNNGHQTQSR